MEPDLNKPFDGDLAQYLGHIWIWVAHLQRWIRLDEAGRMVFDVRMKL